MTAILTMQDVTKSFGTGHTQVTAAKHINFTMEENELVAVIGPSGSGKSTFLTLAAGLQMPSEGVVQVGDQPLHQLSKKELVQLRFHEIGFILQNTNLVPFLTVKKQFELINKINKNKSTKYVELLESLGIKELMDKFPQELSGGEQQRVAIAIALYHDPQIILADEPTASLDSERAFDVMRILAKECKRTRKGIIIVTHDERLLSYCDRVVRMKDGVLTN